MSNTHWTVVKSSLFLDEEESTSHNNAESERIDFLESD